MPEWQLIFQDLINFQLSLSLSLYRHFSTSLCLCVLPYLHSFILAADINRSIAILGSLFFCLEIHPDNTQKLVHTNPPIIDQFCPDIYSPALET